MNPKSSFGHPAPETLNRHVGVGVGSPPVRDRLGAVGGVEEAVRDQPPDRMLADAVAVGQAAEQLGQRQIDALYAGRQALAVEADGWSNLAELTTASSWRAEFDVRSQEAERQRSGLQALQQQLLERDRSAEQEAER